MPIAGTRTKPVKPVMPAWEKAREEMAARAKGKPTELEVAEGIAWKRLQACPEDEDAQDDYSVAFNALQAAQGIKTSLFRCSACGVTQYGKCAGQDCGHCGEELRRFYGGKFIDPAR